MIDYALIEDKIASLIKRKIQDEGLVETGKLLNSISVKYSNGGFIIIAEDYFKYLDGKHKITEFVFNSQELRDFIEIILYKELNDNI